MKTLSLATRLRSAAFRTASIEALAGAGVTRNLANVRLASTAAAQPQAKKADEKSDGSRKRRGGKSAPAATRAKQTIIKAIQQNSLFKIKSVSEFESALAAQGQRILNADVSLALQVLGELLRKEGVLDMGAHPSMITLLKHIGDALNPATWRKPATPTAGGDSNSSELETPVLVATTASEGGATSAPPDAASSSSSQQQDKQRTAFKPYWREAPIHVPELACLAERLTQLRLDHNGDLLRSIVPLLLPQLTRSARWTDVPRLLRAYGNAGVAAPALYAALGTHALSQVPLMDAAAVADTAHFLANRPEGYAHPDPKLFQLLALRLSALLAGKPALAGSARAAKQQLDNGYAGGVPPATFAQALMGLASANLRSDALIQSSKKGFSLGGAPVERSFIRHIIRNARSFEARPLAAVARAAGSMGLCTREIIERKRAHKWQKPDRTGEQEGDDDKLWSVIEARCAQLLPSLSPTDLSFLVNAFADASAAVATEIQADWQRRSAAQQEINGLLLRNPGAAAFDGSSSSIPATAYLPEEDAELLANGFPRVGSDQLWSGLRLAFIAQLPSSSPDVVSFGARAFVSVGVADPELLLAACARMTSLLQPLTASAPSPSAAAADAVASAASSSADEVNSAAAESVPAEQPTSAPAAVADGWDSVKWDVIRSSFGDGMLATSANFARVLASVPPAMFVPPPLPAAAAGGEAAAAPDVSAGLRPLAETVEATATLAGVVARALFESAVNPSPASAAAMPLAMPDATMLLDACVGRANSVRRAARSGLLGPQPSPELESALQALALSVQQLAASLSVRILSATDPELVRGRRTSKTSNAAMSRQLARALRNAVQFTRREAAAAGASGAPVATRAAPEEVAAMVEEAISRVNML